MESTGVGAWLIVIVVLRSRVPDPVVALMVMGNAPVAVGVPLRLPLEDNEIPVGRVPDCKV